MLAIMGFRRRRLLTLSSALATVNVVRVMAQIRGLVYIIGIGTNTIIGLRILRFYVIAVTYKSTPQQGRVAGIHIIGSVG
jgi:hypothetical protein